jgi:hypothetical protein
MQSPAMVLHSSGGSSTTLSRQSACDASHVYLGDESVGLGFAFEEGPDLGVERLEMGFRSFELGAASG